jgi:hypothetical protein
MHPDSKQKYVWRKLKHIRNISVLLRTKGQVLVQIMMTHFTNSMIDKARTYCSPARASFSVRHPFVATTLFVTSTDQSG